MDARKACHQDIEEKWKQETPELWKPRNRPGKAGMNEKRSNGRNVLQLVRSAFKSLTVFV